MTHNWIDNVNIMQSANIDQLTYSLSIFISDNESISIWGKNEFRVSGWVSNILRKVTTPIVEIL